MEYIKSTYRRRESLPCELDCFCSKLSVSERDGRGHVLKPWEKKGRTTGKRREKGMSFWGLMDGYDSRKIHPHWLTANCSVVVLVKKRNVDI